MYAIPNSSAMDAAAGGSGPTARVLPWIAGTDPDQVLKYVTDLVGHISRIVGVMGQVGDAGGELRKAWPAGSASDGALAKVQASITTFQRIVKTVETLQAEIVGVATTLRMAQNAYRSVVSSVNPTVAALLSNVHTHAAARSLAVGSTSGLASFVSATKATLDTIGTVRLMAVVTLLSTIAKELESLLSGGDTAPSTPATVTTPAPTGYGTGGWNDGGASFAPGSSASAVPPAFAAPPATPATLPAGPGPVSGSDVTISTTHGDVKIDISLPAGAADDLAIDLTVTDDGKTFTEHINLDLDGSDADGAPARV